MERIIPIIDTKPFEVFLDLDGVFADFDGLHFKLTGKWPHEVDKKEMWKTVNRHPHYFYSLELCSDAEHLWAYTKQYTPTFLTGLPSGNNGRAQKVRWVAEKFGSEWNVIVLPRREKQNYSGPNKVLIDDNAQLIDQWNEKGGLGVLHKGDVWETIAILEELREAYRVQA